MLREFCAKVSNGYALLACGEALVDYLKITRAAADVLRPSEAQRILDAMLRFLNMHQEAAIPFIPKFHLMVHLGYQSLRMGNPICLATWHDESLNAQLAKMAASAHPLVFERRTLATFNSCNVTMPGGSSERPAKKAKVG